MLKIISGGQTGVDRAALDAARAAGAEIGGWCPAGRKAEDGRISEEYPLQETEANDYTFRTKKNVLEADATLILSDSSLAGGTLRTVEFAEEAGRPLRIVNPQTQDATQTAEWIRGFGIGVLNVAGPRESERPGIYASARGFVRELLHHLEFSE